MKENKKSSIMKNFWKYAALLMTAAAGGMLTSCQDKDDTGPEEEPITIRKVWLMEYIDEDMSRTERCTERIELLNVRSVDTSDA